MDELTRVVSMQGLVRHLEEALDQARAMRDLAVYDYAQDPNVNRRELCRQLGISSARLYGILSGESDRRTFDQIDGHILELREEATRQLWDEAFFAWEESGRDGRPEDYVDVSDLHVRL